ncbi:MAG: hypothetical protein HY079_10690, partial [Elusimicrobia bacterium]|nr:hypothetical protein [Elusimicrobiota bacterium]
ALHGLSELPPEVFRGLLRIAARDPDWRVQTAAAALAADHRGDARLDAAMAELAASARARAQDPRDDRAADVLEWLSRADRPRLCAPAAR